MITARNLSLTLCQTTILKDISLQLRAGELVALCGPNGAGKSSLLSCLAGDYADCFANVSYDDLPLTKLNAHDLSLRRVVLEQSPSLAANFTIGELIGLSAPLALGPSSLDNLVSEVLAQFGFADREHMAVADLSGGQRHRVHLARVLVQLKANQILGYQGYFFLDEPTSSLDLKHQINVLRLMRDLANAGTGILVVLHDLNLATSFADRIILMRDGRIFSNGKPEDIITTNTVSEVYETTVIVDKLSNGQFVIQPKLDVY